MEVKAAGGSFQLPAPVSSCDLLCSGGFLSDAGWYGDAEKVFLSCLQLCTLHCEVLHCFRAVECCVRSVLTFTS